MEKTNGKITIEMEDECASCLVQNLTAFDVVSLLGSFLIKFSRENGIPLAAIQSAMSKSYHDSDDNLESIDNTVKSEKTNEIPTVDDLIQFLKSVGK